MICTVQPQAFGNVSSFSQESLPFESLRNATVSLTRFELGKKFLAKKAPKEQEGKCSKTPALKKKETSVGLPSSFGRQLGGQTRACSGRSGTCTGPWSWRWPRGREHIAAEGTPLPSDPSLE